MDVETRTEGEVLIGRYVLEQPLGSGGAGVVWRADDRLLQRPVAVKLLHPELAHDPATAARFRSEASSAAKLAHPNAVMVYDIGRDGARDFLVMELVDGPALSELIAAGPLTADATAYLGVAIASALGLAHRRGMLHRDVKPANVLLDAEGVPKVADFGIARALGEAAARLTAPGSVMGTARYLAPEQLLDGPLDGRVDVYALGLVLHEALTGRAPWGSGTALEIASRRLSGDLRPPSAVRSDIPPGLDAVIQRATRLEADERYADGAAMAAALDPLVGAAGRHELTRRLRDLSGLPARATPARADTASRRAVAGVSGRAAPPQPRSPQAAPPPALVRPQASQTRPPQAAPPVVPTSTSPQPVRASPAVRASRPARGGKRAAEGRARRGADPRPRPRRGRRRMRRLLVISLLVAGMAVAGAQLDLPTVTDLGETIRDTDVGDLMDAVRDGVSGRLGG